MLHGLRTVVFRVGDLERAKRLVERGILTSTASEHLTMCAHLAAGEFESLQAERQRLRMSGVLAEGITRALQLIYDDDDANAHGLLASACHELDSGSAIAAIPLATIRRARPNDD